MPSIDDRPLHTSILRLAGHDPAPAGFVVTGAVDPGAVAEAYAALGATAGITEPAVAVRSSATGEDGTETSFAGQHDTFLRVRGAAALLDAIFAARASGGTDRVLAYRRSHGADAPDGPLPVLVQLLGPVAAEAIAR